MFVIVCKSSGLFISSGGQRETLRQFYGFYHFLTFESLIYATFIHMKIIYFKALFLLILCNKTSNSL